MAPDRLKYPRHYRLTRGADLRRVLREGKRARSDHLEVRVLVSLLLHSRVGIIVPKHRHTGVERNRLKRRLREIVRQDIIPIIPRPADVVVRASPRAYNATVALLRADLVSGISRITQDTVNW